MIKKVIEIVHSYVKDNCHTQVWAGHMRGTGFFLISQFRLTNPSGSCSKPYCCNTNLYTWTDWLIGQHNTNIGPSSGREDMNPYLPKLKMSCSIDLHL